MMKSALVLGGGGFIGHQMVKKLKAEGFYVRAVDLKFPDFGCTEADDFVIGDLRDQQFTRSIIDRNFEEVYQFAADMGGAGYIFTGDNDADIMYNSASINLNVLQSCLNRNIKRVFYSSSACIYPSHNQLDPQNPLCSEESAYPANPDSEYGWEKLFSERLYLSYNRNHGMECRIARYHNIFGSEGTWEGGKEKAPAALCRKVAECPNNGVIQVWGDGMQTRSFLHVSECIEGSLKLMRGEFVGPVNIGSEEMISINDLAKMVISISNKKISVQNVSGPEGVRGRNSDNKLIFKSLGWKPSQSLQQGIEHTYGWIKQQVDNKR
jgi:nucleoside-diphosphate-sugar epimerase